MIFGFIVLWLSVLTSIIYISAETRQAEWSTSFISSGVNDSIVGVRVPSISLLICSVECMSSSQYGSFYYSTNLQECYCNTQIDGTVVTTTVNTGLMYGIREIIVQNDCLGLYQQGFSTDGVYVLYPVIGVPVEAWCDMTGGGWTVIQRRQDGSENFNRLWNDYANGFGNRTGEYWLGLETIHTLTNINSSLRVYVESDVASTTSDYSHFAVGTSATKYQLSVSGFTGTCGDPFETYHNGLMFATPDNDNAILCADQYQSGWWVNSCWRSNLNLPFAGGIWWRDCMTPGMRSVMKIRRNV